MKRMLIGVVSFFILNTAIASIQSGADHLINEVDPNINIGIEVNDLTTGKTLFNRNQNRLFIPASNMKLFSDAAALMVLGPDYKFRNELAINHAKIRHGLLTGDLYLYLSGDPSFSRERLAQLIQSLKKWQVESIQGNIIIDSSHANINPYAPGWMVEDLAYSYGAPLAPMMIDANRMTVTVNPAGKAGDPAIVEIDDISGGIYINNQVKTKENSQHCGVDFAMDRENHLTVRGCVGVGQWAVMQKMAIRNPLLYGQALLRHLLNQNNIKFDGNITLGKMPKGSMLLARDLSKSVAQLMADTLKPSDNLYADSLFLHAAAKLQGLPVNWQEAEILIKKFLEQQTGINLQKSVLIDGSGLSRYDLLTPHQTVSLLNFLFDRFPLTYEYIAALPVSGRDGTLQKRFRKPHQQDLVRAKTGTMTGVMSLSGYLYTANAHTLAFAMYINNLPGTHPNVSGKYRYLIDALCSYFLQQRPDINAWSKVFGSNNRLIRYQLNPTQAELQRSLQARWRRLEMVIKKALKGQAVTVVFRGDELILKDQQPNAGNVLHTLEQLSKKYPFSAALTSPVSPAINITPLVLWTEASAGSHNIQRIWTIKETATH